MFRLDLKPLLLASALSLTSCSTSMTAVRDSLQQVFPPSGASDAVKLDPSIAYLRTTIGRHVGFAWLGNTARSEDGVTEVYYTSGGEVLRIKNGRLVGSAGLPTEWRRVSLIQPPSWKAVAGGKQPITFQRIRDVMPGYHSDVHETLAIRRIEPPRGSALRGVDPNTVVWFEETVTSPPGRWSWPLSSNDDPALPPARYAVSMEADKETVVYSEQCLARDLCLSLQRWSAAMQQAKR